MQSQFLKSYIKKCNSRNVPTILIRHFTLDKSRLIKFEKVHYNQACTDKNIPLDRIITSGVFKNFCQELYDLEYLDDNRNNLRLSIDEEVYAVGEKLLDNFSIIELEYSVKVKNVSNSIKHLDRRIKNLEIFKSRQLNINLFILKKIKKINKNFIYRFSRKLTFKGALKWAAAAITTLSFIYNVSESEKVNIVKTIIDVIQNAL